MLLLKCQVLCSPGMTIPQKNTSVFFKTDSSCRKKFDKNGFAVKAEKLPWVMIQPLRSRGNQH